MTAEQGFVRDTLGDVTNSFKETYFAVPAIVVGVGMGTLFGHNMFLDTFQHTTSLEIKQALFPLYETTAVLYLAGIQANKLRNRILGKTDQPSIIASDNNPVSASTPNFSDPSLFETGMESVM